MDTALRSERVALGAGVAFALAQLAFLVVFAVLIVPKMPALTAPLREHVAFYEAHHGLLAAVNYLALATIPLFLVFVGGIFSLMRQAEGTVGTLTVIAVGSAVALATASASGIAVAHAGQTAVPRGLGGAEVYAMDSVAQLAIGFTGFPRAILLVAMAVALRGAGTMSRPTFVAALAIAALALVGTLDFIAPALFMPAALASVLGGVWLGAVAGSRLLASRAAPRTRLVGAQS